jgi:hypothetical protein
MPQKVTREDLDHDTARLMAIVHEIANSHWLWPRVIPHDDDADEP